MAEPIHTGPDGRKYRHVATVTTTPTTDTSAKLIDVNAETVCPNMTNEEFAKTVMHVRDVAIKLADVRITNLSRWNVADRAEVIEWFGSDGDDIRSILQTGLPQMKRVLSSLTPSNFVRWSITALNHLNCSGNGDRNTAAAVCSPDVATHTIAIGINFCEMPDEKKVFGTNVMLDGDSKLLTLVHEISHFADVMKSGGEWYGVDKSRKKATAKDVNCIRNADNIASYVIGIKKANQ